MDTNVNENVKQDGRCPACGRMMPALSRMHGLRHRMLPTVIDDASWAELEADHAEGCYWHETRGFRVFAATAPGAEPGVHVVSPEVFNAVALAHVTRTEGRRQ